MILFLVEFANIHVITYDIGREAAKRNAHDIIGGNPDNYIVTPLTEKGDRIFLSTIAIAT